MPDEIGEIDLSDFDLDDDEEQSPVAMAEPDVSGLSANVMAELGLGGFAGLPDSEQASTNGQDHEVPVATMPEVFPEPDYRLPLQVPDLKPGDPYIIPNIANLGPQTTPPSTGFGLFEQLLLEVSRLNLEVAGLRQQLSNFGVITLGPSAQAPQRTQRTAAATPTTEGGVSPTADAPAVRRRRGRPRKEDEEITIEM